MCYIIKCEWLKNVSSCLVTCKYFPLILQPLPTVTNRINIRYCIFIAVFQEIIWLHIFKTCLTSYENRSETGLIWLKVSDVSFKSHTGYE